MQNRSTTSNDPDDRTVLGATGLNVPLADLHPGSERLHRAVDLVLVERMLAAWDPRVLTPLLVMPRRSGGYDVIDGHHRLEALRRRGDALVPVRVIQPLSVRERAELVHRIDAARPRPLHGQDRYKILLAGEEPVTVAIEEALTSFELTGLHTGGADEVRAVTALREAFGQEARTPYSEVSAERIEEGRSVLEWVIRTALMLGSSAAPASHLLGKEIASALIWIRRNARAVPCAEQIGEVFSTVNPRRMREHLISAAHGKGSAGTTQAGLVLAAFINRTAHRDLVELDDAVWARLD